MRFTEKLSNCHPAPGQIGIFWLGQAGFLIKNSKGELLAIDPYLSNAVERICGLKRLMMPVMEPEELNPDCLLVSHHDEDHLDMDIIPGLLSRNPNAKLFGPSTVYRMCQEAGVNESQLVALVVGWRQCLPTMATMQKTPLG